MSTQTDRILPTLQELRDNGEYDPRASLIFQALGAASVCWGSLEDAGVFDSDRAKQIGNELLSELEDQPSEPKLTADQLREEMELLGSMIRAERSTATEANRQCTDEQLERCYQLRDRLTKAAQ